jgi:hypothetical protein
MEQAQDKIESFKRHLHPDNLKNLSTSEWKKIFSSELAFTFTTKPYNVNPNFLFRARINLDSDKKTIDYFNHVDELWAPDKMWVKKQGRCNEIGQSILYCSTCLMSTLFEVKPDTGNELTFIEYRTFERIKQLGAVGIREIVTIGDDYKDLFGNHFANSSVVSQTLDNILSDIFKSKTENTETHPIYNLTNAILQIFLHEPQEDIVPNDQKPPKFNGLIYPSVETTKITGMNMALEPLAVKPLLKPHIAFKYKVLKKHSEHLYEIILTHMSKEINPDGKIQWTPQTNAVVEYISDIK